MNVSFLLNTGLAVFLVLTTSILNVFAKEKIALHYRMMSLGLGMTVSMGLYSLWQLGIFPHTGLFIWILGFSNWACAVLYVSLLFDLTASHRPRFFYLAYFLPAPLATLLVILPQPIGVVVLSFFGIAYIVVFSLIKMVAWIQAATDERARRDGQWFLFIYSVFTIGILISVVNNLTGVFWILSILYAFTYGAINFLKIFQQLTNPENQLIIDNVFDIIVILDANGKITRVNRRGYQITGFSFLSLTGNGIELLLIHNELYPESRARWLRQYGYADSTFGNHRSSSIDGFLATKIGEEIPVDIRIISLLNLDKKITGYIVSATDMRMTHQLMKEISDREYATRELALSESKFSRMFLFNPTGILIVNLESQRITEANPATEFILECESSSLIGKTLHDIGLEMREITFENFLEKIVMEGTVSEFGARIVLGSKKIKKCHLSAVSFDMKGVGHILLSVVDVTKHENMSEALAKKQKLETIGLLAGGIAHDFNNILAVILGHIGLAKMRTVDQHARIPIEKAEKACLRAREITGQLLVFSRGGKPIIGLCNTRKLIVDTAMIAVNDTSIACLFNIDKQIWSLKADAIQIGQVLANLIGNAVQAMDKKGIIEIHAQNRDYKNISAHRRPVGLDTKPLAPGTYVEISIHDQGPGIPSDVRPKIFDPFFSTKEKGTGLGLSIVFSIIQNHNGTIKVDTAEGEGSVFSIFVPADPSLVVEEIKADAEPVKSSGVNTRKVLVMDDDTAVRESATNMLSSLGLEVIETCEGNEAFALFKAAKDSGKPFDFCILDLIIHNGVSGLECAKKILAIDEKAILLVSSGYSDDSVLSHHREYGFTGILPKPYSLEELREALSGALVL